MESWWGCGEPCSQCLKKVSSWWVFSRHLTCEPAVRLAASGHATSHPPHPGVPTWAWSYSRFQAGCSAKFSGANTHFRTDELQLPLGAGNQTETKQSAIRYFLLSL